MSSAAPSPTLLRQVLPTRAEIAAARRRLHRKAAVIFTVAAAGYGGLVFGSWGWPLRVVAAVVLVHGCVAIATGVMHDANHSAFSASAAVNRVFAFSADLLGASSAFWRQQHNVLHHRHTNVLGVDADIEQAPFARLAPHQQWRRWHRFQHLYMWPLYGFLVLKWFLIGDYRTLRAYRRRPVALVRCPSGGAVAAMFVGKFAHLGWALVVPMMFHPWWQVALVYVACSWSVGFALAVIFQLAHCVDRADFVDAGAASITGDAMFRHQLATTVDIVAGNRFTRAYTMWLMGGLDHQVEHHLAPRLPHTVYPLLARRVDALCAENGLVRRTHRGIGDALGSHVRWLRAMGAQPTC